MLVVNCKGYREHGVMKILIADNVSPGMIAEFEGLGGEVIYKPELTAESLPDSIDDAGYRFPDRHRCVLHSDARFRTNG